jgi:hypothetical protein
MQRARELVSDRDGTVLFLETSLTVVNPPKSYPLNRVRDGIADLIAMSALTRLLGLLSLPQIGLWAATRSRIGVS